MDWPWKLGRTSGSYYGPKSARFTNPVALRNIIAKPMARPLSHGTRRCDTYECTKFSLYNLYILLRRPFVAHPFSRLFAPVEFVHPVNIPSTWPSLDNAETVVLRFTDTCKTTLAPLILYGPKTDKLDCWISCGAFLPER